MKQNTVKKLHARLQEYRSQILACLTKLIRDEQSAVRRILSQMAEVQKAQHSRSIHNIEQTRLDLLAAIKAFRPREGCDSDLTPVKRAATRLEKSAQAIRKNDVVLRSLCFHTMQQRYARVHEAYAQTFDWAFEGSSATRQHVFTDWLASGSGSFWIKGKAGSGKSTFMKYLLRVSSSSFLVLIIYFTNTAAHARLLIVSKSRHLLS